MIFELMSPAFEYGSPIPSVYTCDGTDLSPPLSWSGVPEGTRSLALLVDDPDAPDPDAPKMVWVHWVLYNLPANTKGLVQAVTDSALPAAARHGLSDWKRSGYGGPCPPIGRHRYFFKLYALDVELPDLHEPNGPTLEQSIKSHVLAHAVLMGTYEREK
jgi:Raf kinase inhibitor-like YbhB/YbcL family protein